ncbi:MAG: MG2 domain-containing protein [Caldilineaceae bacterium]
MSRSILFALIASTFVLALFTFYSGSYRATVDDQGNQSPLVTAAQAVEQAATAPVKEASAQSSAPIVQFRGPMKEPLPSRQPTLYLAFDQPMDHASVEAALQVEPPAALALEWLVNTLYIRPQAPLQPGMVYTFTLATTATNAAGVPLAAAYQWRQRSPNTAQQLLPTDSTRLDSPLTLTFSHAMQPVNPGDIVHLEPPTPLTARWNPEATTLYLTPADPLLPGVTYRLAFGRPLVDAEGYAVQLPKYLEVTTIGPVISASTLNGYTTSPYVPLQITFATPLDQAATAASLQLTPTVTGTQGWLENTLIFTPTQGYWPPQSIYAVSVRHIGRNAKGDLRQSSPTTWSFNTGDLVRWADWGYGVKVQLIDAAGPRKLAYHLNGNEDPMRRPSTLDFALYPLDRATLLQLLQRDAPLNGYELMSTAGLTPTVQWQAAAQWNGPAGYWQNVYTTQIPTATPPGLYLLNLTTGYSNDQLLVQLSHHTLALKVATGQMLAWVTALNGAVQTGVQITVYATDGATLATGVTDAAGLAQLSLPADATPSFALAQVDAEMVVAALRNEWHTNDDLTSFAWQPVSVQPRYSSYLYTDRPLYQPGQTVYFKGILREDADASLTTPPGDTPVVVRVHDARDNVVQSYNLATNAFGTVHGEFTIAEGALLGDYALVLEVAGTTARYPFMVEEYRKPDYRVTIRATNIITNAALPLTVTVESHYLTGQPVANANVTIKRYQQDLLLGWGGESRPMYWTPGDLEPLTGVTDSAGRLTTTLILNPAGAVGVDNQPLGQWALEATVTDRSNVPSSDYMVVQLPLVTETLQLQLPAAAPVLGQPFVLAAHSVNATGAPIPYDQLHLSVANQQTQGALAWPGIHEVELFADQQGSARIPMLAETPGFYHFSLERRSPYGYASTSTNLLVYDPTTPWQPQPDGYFAIRAEQAQLRPGDVAQLQIDSTFDGPALITLQRGQVRRTQLVELTPPLTHFALPIEESDAPNIFVTANAWTPPQLPLLTKGDWQSRPESRLRQAQIELTVAPVNKRLTIAIVPDQASYAPHTSATLQLTVTDELGEPVEAELSLALVDEAILQLSQDHTTPLFDTFYAPRPDLVHTYDALAPIRFFNGGGGGGGGGGFAPANPRRAFPDTAAWLPDLTTDANGHASVTLHLPDSLTTWRVMVKAVTLATQVGEAAVAITTTQPVSIQPLLPPGLTRGDYAGISALVHNTTATARTVTVTLAISATAVLTTALPLSLIDLPSQRVHLYPGETLLVGWAVKAQQAGAVNLLFVAQGEEDADSSDAILLPLAIRPRAIPNVVSQVGDLADELTTAITLPMTLTGLERVEIEVNRSLVGSLLEGVDYLTGYPYGCVEQTMSKALPNAVIGRAFSQVGRGAAQVQAQLPHLINAGLQRLYGFQHDDGGWGWWYDDNSDAYQSAWVLFGLAVTADAGYEVSPQVIERGIAYLAQRMETLDSRTQAFALYALALTAPGAYVERMQALSDQLDALDPFSQAALALALHDAGEGDRAQAVMAHLLATVTVEQDLAYWSGDDYDGNYYAKTMASATRSTALALRALLQIDPDNPLEPQIVAWLMSRRQEQGWGTTNETAFTLLALTDHLLHLAGPAADALYAVTLNETVISTGTLSAATPRAQVTLTAAQLQVGVNQLQLRRLDGGHLYYRILAHTFADDAHQPAGVVTIYRDYIDPETRQPLQQAKAGQLVEVQLTVQTNQEAAYFMVEDHLPGGLEALNEGLNRSNRVSSSMAQSEMVQAAFPYSYPYNYKEVRRDRVTFFITELHVGVWTVTYLARAVTIGDFAALPTEGYAMYDPELWGRSASSRIVIEERETVGQ